MAYPRSRVPSYMYSEQYSGFSPQQQYAAAAAPRPRAPFGGSSSVSSFTTTDPGYNTSDPALLHGRVFVGNLDTSKVTREQILQKYSCFGTILGLTVFKGYAFVQYGTYEEAIHAVGSSNKTVLAGQALDVKLVSESQSQTRAPAQKHKQQTYYGGGPQVKKQKNDVSSPGNNRQLLSVPVSANKQAAQKPPLTIEDDTKREDLLSYDFPDTLICGNCRSVFTDWFQFRDHRKSSCTPGNRKPEDEPDRMLCFVCKESFNHSWHLLMHLSDVHHLHVYAQEGEENGGTSTKVEDVQNEMNKDRTPVE